AGRRRCPRCLRELMALSRWTGHSGRCRGAGRMPHPWRRGNGPPAPRGLNPSPGAPPVAVADSRAGRVGRMVSPMPRAATRASLPLAVPDAERALLARGEHHDPHAVLGVHPTPTGAVVRAFHPEAKSVELIRTDGGVSPMSSVGDGVWATLLPGIEAPLAYRLRFTFADGATWERDDPYRFGPTVGELDLHLIGEGAHERLYDVLGAHPLTIDGTPGVAFAVWAPNARGARVVGDFSRWDGRLLPMRSLGSSGVWELFVPGVVEGELYKFEVLGRDGSLRLKADPLSFAMQVRPETAARVWET